MTDFEIRYSKIYRKVFEFHQRRYGAKTDEDWTAIALEAGKLFTDKFEIDLGIAILHEIERESKEHE